ncbi:NEDD8-activating enzyme E1 regulatory subunit [Patellaria atrata CBS 101060]|uniref:NEDD8-activating enzyme E1 regulatory subunit n=1 Tax=Patellaria atrata CBS 101060 TaxID=1346257 RepID=A0A9P4SA85_9PEZI|nr:NEDD8-activating enzyme E1 regulatory subunit [Patellaria atrata CBS 101060]
MIETTPPPLQGPTSKEKKYDRQLRLWAASGQAALEDAHILLVNSGSGVLGVETLKNLVLPGIGNFTILDSSVVSEADLGINFFLEEDSLGGFRAEHTCKLLKELNPDVQGHFIAEPIESFITKEKPLDPYTLILVAAPIDPEILTKITLHAQATQKPVFYFHNVGFYSHFSIYLSHVFPIVDTHPDSATTSDLRLLKPWPGLLEFMTKKTTDLEQMSDHDHGHIPYVLLILYYLEKWKGDHDGKVPRNYKEKIAFRDQVRQGARTHTAEGGEENYDEAIAAVLKSLNPPSASSAVKEVFKSEECKLLAKDSPSFWVVANAISQFYEERGELPLPGSVPDMKAQSADYIQLQNVYKSKAREDFTDVVSRVRRLEDKLGRTVPVADKEIEAFCKNADHIKLICGRPFHIARAGEKVRWNERAKVAASMLENRESLIHLYIAFLAYDIFTNSHDADALGGAPLAPGEQDLQLDGEKMAGIAYKIVDDLLTEANKFLEGEEYDTVKSRTKQFVEEIVRAGGAELHNIATLSGGLIAQEVIKAVTKQYVPVDNTCMFDGVVSKMEVLRL